MGCNPFFIKFGPLSMKVNFVSAWTISGVLPFLAASVLYGVCVWRALACCRFRQEVRVWRKSRDFSWLVVSASCQIVRCQCVSFRTEVCGVARHGMSFRCVARFCGKLVRHVASFEGNSVVRLVEGFFGKCVVCTRGFSSFSVFQ